MPRPSRARAADRRAGTDVVQHRHGFGIGAEPMIRRRDAVDQQRHRAVLQRFGIRQVCRGQRQWLEPVDALARRSTSGSWLVTSSAREPPPAASSRPATRPHRPRARRCRAPPAHGRRATHARAPGQDRHPSAGARASGRVAARIWLAFASRGQIDPDKTLQANAPAIVCARRVLPMPAVPTSVTQPGVSSRLRYARDPRRGRTGAVRMVRAVVLRGSLRLDFDDAPAPR